MTFWAKNNNNVLEDYNFYADIKVKNSYFHIYNISSQE